MDGTSGLPASVISDLTGVNEDQSVPEVDTAAELEQAGDQSQAQATQEYEARRGGKKIGGPRQPRKPRKRRM